MPCPKNDHKNRDGIVWLEIVVHYYGLISAYNRMERTRHAVSQK